jgi:DNA mismatch repair protein MSH4
MRLPNRKPLTDSQSIPSRPITGQSRPITGQSRPTTARPQTAASNRHDSYYIIALFEGRGVAREVGLAALNRETGQVILVQVRQVALK